MSTSGIDKVLYTSSYYLSKILSLSRYIFISHIWIVLYRYIYIYINIYIYIYIYIYVL